MKLRSRKSSLGGHILIPASKSHTIRALAIASLAHGESVIKNPLKSEDIFSCINACKILGAEIQDNGDWVVRGFSGTPKPAMDSIDIGNSGTSLRILTSIAALGSRPTTFDGDESIKKRPMEPLLTALGNLGVKVRSDKGKCPLTIEGPMHGGKTTVNGISSQFLSSLLISCPLAKNDTEIKVQDLHEKPYVQITLDWLDSQSIDIEYQNMENFRIKGGQLYKNFTRVMPSDFSSATFALCAAAVTGSEILIKGLDFSDPQGDRVIFDHLENMGAKLVHGENGVTVKGDELTGADLDLNSTPDALPALAVVGCFAKGRTRLLNVPQARLKECDRIKAMVVELTKMGARAEELSDGLVIHQSRIKGTFVHGYNDHRMVMALALAGMACGGQTEVDTAESIKITYPTFVEDMKALGADIEISE
jgi:3-phosphoshikimate 1-carboxyvinyltransferase